MTGAAPIRRLEQPVADAIAAGEVVERPASVIKELCENALDSGASRIDVDIDGGGITRMRVTDNGTGIPAAELPLAVARHATSKIAVADDLERIMTLGFRGEALASIAAVSELTITSSEGAGGGGAMLRSRAGTITQAGHAATAPGTAVEVCDLFMTTPARLRFLKSAKTEVGAATRVVADLALSHPEVAFICRVDGRVSVRTPGGTLREALAAVLGAGSASDLIDVDAPGTISVRGAISEPRAHRATRHQAVVVVNARRIHHRALTVAIEDAYRGLLPNGRYPFGVVSIDVDPVEVDVNVHPAKREVRFRDERAVFSAVQRACWHALQGSQPYAVAPGWDATGGGRLGGLRVRDGGGRVQPAALLPWGADDPRPAGPAASPSATPPMGEGTPAIADEGSAVRVVAPDAPAPEHTALTPMRAIGQVGTTWVVAESMNGGVVLVDPHAAHEKVLYAELAERWRAAPLGDGTAQLMLLPVIVECDPRQMAAAAAAADFLTGCGFGLDEFGPATLRCSAVPAVAADADVATLVTDLLDELDDERGPVDERQHRIAALVACHSAVRFGDRVAPVEQQRLLDALIGTPGALTCPHGRPTVLVLDDAALRRAFRRPVS